MKAERRHELQTNSLTQFLHDLPHHLQVHANKILLVIIVICLIFLLVRHRINTAAEAKEQARASLLLSRSQADRLRSIDSTATNDIARAQERKKAIDTANAAIDQVFENTTDPEDAALRAEALVARGDLNWAIANLPPLAGSSTMPSISVTPTTRESLDSAEKAYQEVLSDYGTQKFAKASALLALANIEENRGNWDKAATHYNTIVNDATLSPMFKDMARLRLEIIPQIKKPAFLGTFSSTQPATLPTTEPTTMTTTVGPASSPVVQPATNTTNTQ